MTADKMGGPAFPTPVADDRDCAGRFVSGYGGMTLWDYFAAAALTATRRCTNGATENTRITASIAASIADAMMEERAKRMEQSND